MHVKTVIFSVFLMMTLSLSGCLGGGKNPDDDQTTGSPDDVKAENYNVLYIGHSFGKRFAQTLENYAHTASFSNHSQHIEFSGGASGAPDALWANDGHRENIKAYLDTGEIDVMIMICCSIEFMETGAQSDEAIWNFTDYALDKNPDTRLGLALPWKDFPADYDNSTDYRNGSDEAFDSWVNLASNLSSDYPSADVFTIYHGAVAYELREMFENGELEGDIEQLTGSKTTSIFTDAKGHAGNLMIDTGSLIWLHAVHGVDPMTMPEFTEWEVDPRQLAKSLVEKESE